MPNAGSSEAGGEPKRSAVFWLDPSQADLARAVAALAGLRVTHAGSPESSGRGSRTAVADALEAEPAPDLRRALTAVEADLVFLGTAADDGAGCLDDPDLLRACRERGARIVSLEPAPAATSAVARYERAAAQVQGAAPAELVRFIPATRRSKGFRLAADALESIGAVRTVTVSQRGGPAHGSLAAKLYDAMDLVVALLGEAESIDAAVCGPAGANGLHLTPGERLRELRGDLTANLRFSGARAAALSLSDAAGRWFRGATIVAQQGCLRLDDKSYEIIGPDGATLDRSRTRLSAGSGGAADPSAAAAIAEQVAQLFDPRAPRPAPVAPATVLAMCEAALLSARTGQPESPATILRMAGAG